MFVPQAFSAISITKAQCYLQHCFYCSLYRFLRGLEHRLRKGEDTLEVVVGVSRLWYKVYDPSQR